MRFLDKKFQEQKFQYIMQSLLAGAAVAFALVFFDVVRQPVIIASFGARFRGRYTPIPGTWWEAI